MFTYLVSFRLWLALGGEVEATGVNCYYWHEFPNNHKGKEIPNPCLLSPSVSPFVCSLYALFSDVEESPESVVSKWRNHVKRERLMNCTEFCWQVKWDEDQEMTLEFSEIETLVDLNKVSFCGVTELKTWMGEAWWKKTGMKWKAVTTDTSFNKDLFEKFCCKGNWNNGGSSWLGTFN